MDNLQEYAMDYQDCAVDTAPVSINSVAPAQYKHIPERVPTYTKTARHIAGLTLDPAESNRNALPEAIQQAFAALPEVSTDDTRLGEALQAEPDLSAWEALPEQGRDRAAVLAASMKTLQGQPRWHSPAVMHNITPAPLKE